MLFKEQSDKTTTPFNRFQHPVFLCPGKLHWTRRYASVQLVQLGSASIMIPCLSMVHNKNPTMKHTILYGPKYVWRGRKFKMKGRDYTCRCWNLWNLHLPPPEDDGNLASDGSLSLSFWPSIWVQGHISGSDVATNFRGKTGEDSQLSFEPCIRISSTKSAMFFQVKIMRTHILISVTICRWVWNQNKQLQIHKSWGQRETYLDIGRLALQNEDSSCNPILPKLAQNPGCLVHIVQFISIQVGFIPP